MTEGPGRIVGDNPLQLADNGGVGAVLVQTIARRTGRIRITASHVHLDAAAVTIHVNRSPRRS